MDGRHFNVYLYTHSFKKCDSFAVAITDNDMNKKPDKENTKSHS